jgi:predicted secreted hydrolase
MATDLCIQAKENLAPSTLASVAAVLAVSHPGLDAASLCTNIGPQALAQIARGINRPQVMAYLMRNYIEGLPSVRFVSSYGARYKLLVDYLHRAEKNAGITIEQMLFIWSFLGKNAFDGYSRVYAPLQFPCDHNLHFGTQAEWYFLVGTGSAPAADGTLVAYGVEMMFMMHDIFPTKYASAQGFNVSDFRVYDVHFAITIAPQGQQATHYRSPKIVLVSGASGLVAYSPGDEYAPMSLQIGDSYMRSQSVGDLFPMAIQFVAVDQKGAPMRATLSVTATKPFFAQGDKGCTPCISGLGSLYYSYSALRATGTITYGETPTTLVLPPEHLGKWWFDHQWMAGMSTPGYPTSLALRALSNVTKGTPFVGWDWFEWSIPSTNTDFTMNAARSTEITTVPSGEVKIEATGKIIDATGVARDAHADLYLGNWLQVDGTVWPLSWRFEFPAQASTPAVAYKLTPLYLLPVGTMGFSNSPYKEGPVSITASDGTTGIGFAESVGYGRRDASLDARLSVLGLDCSDATRSLIKEPPPSAQSKLASGTYLIAIVLLVVLIICAIVIGTKRLTSTTRQAPISATVQ